MMKIRYGRYLVALVAFSLLALAACSDENGQENDSAPDAGEEDVFHIDDNHYEPGNADFHSDYQLRLNAFAFDSGSPGSGLNSAIRTFLNQTLSTPIIVLVELEDIDTDAEQMLIRAGAGLHAGDPGGGEYVWDDEIGEPDSTAGTIDADGNLYAELELLNFVATVQTEEETMKTIIPIRDIDLEGMLRAAEDGSNPRILDAELDGIIWYEEAKELEIVLNPGDPGIALVDVLEEENMNHVYDPDDEGITEDNAWKMSATFSAEETVIVQ